jgi:hypothetical protein
MVRRFTWLWASAALVGGLSVSVSARAEEGGAIVVEVAPAATTLGPDQLRALIATELATAAVPPGDARAAGARGTLTVDVDRGTGELSVTYLAHAVPITRRVPLPASDAAARSATVLLAGNLARDEASGLAAELRKEHPPDEPTAARKPPEAEAARDGGSEAAMPARIEAARLRSTLDYYAQRERASRHALGWGLLGAGVAGGGAAAYLQLQWKDSGGALATGLVGGALAVDALTAFLVTSPFEDLAAYGHQEAHPGALEDAWARAAGRERARRRVSGVIDLIGGAVTIGLGVVLLAEGSANGGSTGSGGGNDAFGSVVLGIGAIEGILGAYTLGTDGPLESAFRAYEASSGRGFVAPAQASGLGPLRIAFVHGGAVAGFAANF